MLFLPVIIAVTLWAFYLLREKPRRPRKFLKRAPLKVWVSQPLSAAEKRRVQLTDAQRKSLDRKLKGPVLQSTPEIKMILDELKLKSADEWEALEKLLADKADKIGK